MTNPTPNNLEELHTLIDTLQERSCNPWYSKESAPPHWQGYFSQNILEDCITLRSFLENKKWEEILSSPYYQELIDSIYNTLDIVTKEPTP